MNTVCYTHSIFIVARGMGDYLMTATSGGWREQEGEVAREGELRTEE